MIEAALVSAIKAATNAEVYAGIVPEGRPLPWAVYREIDYDVTDNYYTRTNNVQFEIDLAVVKGLKPEHYEQTKTMANTLLDALHDGFEFAGVCVYNVDIGKRQDMIDDVDGMYWTRAVYTLTFDSTI